jgi:hypothetical protein
MTADDDPNMPRPSLRIAELAITNFRTFRARTVLSFTDGLAAPDAIVTFHGDNGAGKSNALAALDHFFLALTLCLSEGDDNGEMLLTWDAPILVQDRSLVIAYRNRPSGTNEATVLDVRFQDPRLGALRVRFTPSGKRVRLQAEHRSGDAAGSPAMGEEGGFAPIRREMRDQLLTWLQTPLGPQSRPLAILNERRQPTWLQRVDQGGSLLHSALADQLFAIRTNLDPVARERWRTFGETLQQFPQFRGKDIEIQRTQPERPPEIIVEDRGRTVLRLNELSSGEQQLVVLYASVTCANAPLVVIEEPELSLDDKNQRTFLGLLKELIKSGQVDQVILESHVPAFDDEHVLRFHRSASGGTEVTRLPSAGPEEIELRRKATALGAKPCLVTGDGYTQLPEPMLDDLVIGKGAHVWFLKDHGRWGAWTAAELDQMFGLPGEGSEK